MANKWDDRDAEKLAGFSPVPVLRERRRVSQTGGIPLHLALRRNDGNNRRDYPYYHLQNGRRVPVDDHAKRQLPIHSLTERRCLTFLWAANTAHASDKERAVMSEKQKTIVRLWLRRATCELTYLDVSRTAHLYADRLPRVDDEAEPNGAPVTLQTVQHFDGVIAVAWVSQTAQRRVALNGTPVAAGMHTLHPQDQIDLDDTSYWVSDDRTPDRTTYDPAVHGTGVRCCMTKAPLREGQAIVVCPGTPETPCDAIYTEAAWDAVIESNKKMKCPRCGYRAGQPQWTPSPRTRRENLLDELCNILPK